MHEHEQIEQKLRSMKLRSLSPQAVEHIGRTLDQAAMRHDRSSGWWSRPIPLWAGGAAAGCAAAIAILITMQVSSPAISEASPPPALHVQFETAAFREPISTAPRQWSVLSSNGELLQ